MKHGHHHCAHAQVKFCTTCQLVYCTACDQEWTPKQTWYWPYSYAYGITTGTTVTYPVRSTVLTNTHAHEG